MIGRTPYPTRPGGPKDLGFLWEMLYEAVHHRPLPEPEPSRYLEGWGRPGDTSVVALDPIDGRRIGAAWSRLMLANDPGYGFVDASTPEVALAVVPERRGIGVGEALLRGLLDAARTQGSDALSLSVRRDNPAVKHYERNGFAKLSDIDSEYPSWTMKADLTTRDETKGRAQAPATDEPRD